MEVRVETDRAFESAVDVFADVATAFESAVLVRVLTDNALESAVEAPVALDVPFESATEIAVTSLVALLSAVLVFREFDTALESAVEARVPPDTPFESAVEASTLTLTALLSAVEVLSDAADPADTALESAVEMFAELAEPALVALESATLVFLLRMDIGPSPHKRMLAGTPCAAAPPHRTRYCLPDNSPIVIARVSSRRAVRVASPAPDPRPACDSRSRMYRSNWNGALTAWATDDTRPNLPTGFVVIRTASRPRPSSPRRAALASPGVIFSMLRSNASGLLREIFFPAMDVPCITRRVASAVSANARSNPRATADSSTALR